MLSVCLFVCLFVFESFEHFLLMILKMNDLRHQKHKIEQLNNTQKKQSSKGEKRPFRTAKRS